MKQSATLIFPILLVLSCSALGTQGGGNSSLEDAIRRQEIIDGGEEGAALSRRKRFLVFPDGSSLQLVFCTQTSALIPIGDIFLYGNTAALAWQLPQDPALLLMLKEKHGSQLRRKDDAKHIYYTDDKGKLLYKVPYKRRPIVNPAFAKRSLPDIMQIQNSKLQDESSQQEAHAAEAPSEVDRKRMHNAQRSREFLNIEHMEDPTVEFHRHSRKGLYEKLEVFLKALGVNGYACVRRVLCETGARRDDTRQGNFMQEIMRAVFTLPRGLEFEKEAHREYDTAHRAASAAPATPGAAPAAPGSAACARLYPDCDGVNAEVPLFA